MAVGLDVVSGGHRCVADFRGKHGAADFAAVVAHGERFLAEWERAGRPVSSTLNVAPYAMAMVHGLLGDEAKRTFWIEVTRALTFDPTCLATCETGWAPTFDALLALDRGRADLALACLTADIDDRTVWRNWRAGRWRPWYAALWAEAAVLAKHPNAASRVQRAAVATRDNRIAATIVQRAADLLCEKRKALRSQAKEFAGWAATTSVVARERSQSNVCSRRPRQVSTVGPPRHRAECLTQHRVKF